jgi:hypothetical protein
MLATLVGLSMLLALVGSPATLTGCLLARRRRAHHARRHPAEAAVREHTRQGRRLAAEWPLLAQTLGLGYRDQWTRQHRYPAAEFVADDQGVTATVAAIAGASLADYQRAAGYLADTWGCVSVRAEQQGPGLIRLRGLHRDPLLILARVDLSGMAPESLTSWWLAGPRTAPRSASGWPRSPGWSWRGWLGSARPCSSPISSASSPPPQRCSSC